MNVFLDLPVDVVEAAVGERTARRKDRFQRREVMRLHWLSARFLEHGEILRTGAKDCNPFLVRHIP